jgi:hypothetical protein
MTQDEIIEMAEKAGIIFGYPAYQDRIEIFAKLVEERTAAKEREACAKVCDDTHFTVDSGKHFAARIRARGEA